VAVRELQGVHMEIVTELQLKGAEVLNTRVHPLYVHVLVGLGAGGLPGLHALRLHVPAVVPLHHGDQTRGLGRRRFVWFQERPPFFFLEFSAKDTCLFLPLYPCTMETRLGVWGDGGMFLLVFSCTMDRGRTMTGGTVAYHDQGYTGVP